jgi:hypothetical protein
VLLYLVPAGLAAVALVDLSRSTSTSRSGLPKGAWASYIVLLPLLGPLLWFLFSRSGAGAQSGTVGGDAISGDSLADDDLAAPDHLATPDVAARGRGAATADDAPLDDVSAESWADVWAIRWPTTARRSTPVAPDDDPEFLHFLDVRGHRWARQPPPGPPAASRPRDVEHGPVDGPPTAGTPPR